MIRIRVKNQIWALTGYFLPSEIKVDCLTVSTAPVKATIDDHIQTLMDTLLLTLRRSAMSDINTIDKFITDGMDMLTTRPQTVSSCSRVTQTSAEESSCNYLFLVLSGKPIFSLFFYK